MFGGLANAGERGADFRQLNIDGVRAGDRLGRAVASAGDVNGDGLDDVVFGAPGVDVGSRTDAGAAYVVFGSSSLEAPDLAASDFDGFMIAGAGTGDRLGRSVSTAGDVNADGFGDVIVGAPGADSPRAADSGAAYIVFGSENGGTVDLAADALNGMRIYGATSYDRAGISVTGIGDINNDALHDVAVGAFGVDTNGGFSGSVYVLWGSRVASHIDLGLVGHLPDRGFVIEGARSGDDAGWAVASAGDVNGDEIPDIAVGARGVDAPGYANVGAAYVVFGQDIRARISLRELGGLGYRILGSRPFDLTGSSLALAGDVDQDGLSDLVIGAPRASRSKPNVGVVYVVPAQVQANSVSLPEAALLQINGRKRLAQTGTSVDGRLDFNDDSHADLLVGSSTESHNGDPRCGAVRLFFGPFVH